jgi:hypothetical protein
VAETGNERELVLRLASLLWRLRRATAIESGLFKVQARHLLNFRQRRLPRQKRQNIIDNICRDAAETETDTRQNKDEATGSQDRNRQQALLINPTISHAPLSASPICRPVPSTG